MRSLVLFIFFVFFMGGSKHALSDTFYLTFQNTGSEDVYYSTAIRRMKFVGWGDWRASGWYALPAGSSKQVYAGSDEQVAFAFKKRGGYIKFNNRNSKSSKKWLKGWHVATKDVFDYRFKNQSKPSERLDGFVEMSFGYHYESRSWGTSHIVRQSVNINTSKNNKPIPWTRNARRAATVSPDNFLEALDSAIEENKKAKSRKKDISPHADAPVARTDPRVHKGDGSRLDRLLHESLSNASCYRMEGVLMTYPAFAAGVSEGGSVYVEGLENRVDGKLTNKAGRSSIPLDQVRGTRIVPSRSGAQPRCARLELRCPKKEKCARSEGFRRSSVSLYFNSTERANEVADLLVPPSEDSIKAGAAPKLPLKSDSEPSSRTDKASPLNDPRLYRLFGFVGLIVILTLGVLSFKRNGVNENASERGSEGRSVISHVIFLMANLVIYTGYIFAAVMMAVIDLSDFKGFFDPNDVLENIFTLSGGVFFLVGFGFLLAWINKKPKQKTKRLISFVCTAVYAGSFFVIVWTGPYRGPFFHLGWSYVILLSFFSILPFLGAIIWGRMTIKGARR